MKRKGIFLFLFLFSFLFGGFIFAQDLTSIDGRQQNFKFYKAKIVDVEKKDGEKDLLKVELLNNDRKGEKIEIMNDLRGNPKKLELLKRDRIYVYLQIVNDKEFYIIQDFYHLDGLIWGLILAFGLVILFGRKKGLLSFISLLISLGIIFFVYFPLVLKGWNALWLTFILSIVVSGVVLILVAGFNKKALIAFLATIGGVMFSILMLLLIGRISGLTGFGEESAFFLKVNYPNLDFLNFLYGGMIIGVLGAVMDVAVSIVSSMKEIMNHKKDVSKKKLIKSGINIGRDILGSMMNTLVFAYVGSAMVMLLIILKSQPDFVQFFNFGLIAEEVVRILISMIALAIVIPLSAVIGGFVYRLKNLRTKELTN